MEKLGNIVIAAEEHLDFIKEILNMYEVYIRGGEYQNLTDEEIEARTKEERLNEFFETIKETIEQGTDEKGRLTKQAEEMGEWD